MLAARPRAYLQLSKARGGKGSQLGPSPPQFGALEKQIPLSFASGLLIPLRLVEAPKIAPLIRGWPVYNMTEV